MDSDQGREYWLAHERCRRLCLRLSPDIHQKLARAIGGQRQGWPWMEAGMIKEVGHFLHDMLA